jgi:hypothetical protein
MTSMNTSADKVRCLRPGCGRKLTSAKSVARGYGDGCWRKMRQAERAADLSAWTPAQVAEAEQAIEDGAVVPSTREGVFHVVSVDGAEVHRTALHGCNCTAGLKTYHPRPCWHRCAVAIVTAPPAPAAVTPARVPVAIPAPAPAGDIWAEIERLNEAFMAIA